jgi:hypothetical protein
VVRSFVVVPPAILWLEVPGYDTLGVFALLLLPPLSVCGCVVCSGWTRGTYMIGLWDYYSMSGDETAGNYLKEWGKSYECVPVRQQRAAWRQTR